MAIDIHYNFTGNTFAIPREFEGHELLVIVDGMVKVPHDEWGQGGDYKVEHKDILVFDQSLENACVQVIAVTMAKLSVN